MEESIDTGNSAVITREKGVGVGNRGYEGITGNGRRPGLGWGTNSTIYK